MIPILPVVIWGLGSASSGVMPLINALVTHSGSLSAFPKVVLPTFPVSREHSIFFLFCLLACIPRCLRVPFSFVVVIISVLPL